MRSEITSQALLNLVQHLLNLRHLTLHQGPFTNTMDFHPLKWFSVARMQCERIWRRWRRWFRGIEKVRVSVSEGYHRVHSGWNKIHLPLAHNNFPPVNPFVCYIPEILIWVLWIFFWLFNYHYGLTMIIALTLYTVRFVPYQTQTYGNLLSS